MNINTGQLLGLDLDRHILLDGLLGPAQRRVGDAVAVERHVARGADGRRVMAPLAGLAENVYVLAS